MVNFCLFNTHDKLKTILKDSIVKLLAEKGQYSEGAHWAREFGFKKEEQAEEIKEYWDTPRQIRNVNMNEFHRLDRTKVKVAHVTNERELRMMTQDLVKQSMIFFDTESVIAASNLALIQIATPNTCYLVYPLLPALLQNNAKEGWDELAEGVFNNDDITKVGEC